jgi:hypothetical protein
MNDKLWAVNKFISGVTGALSDAESWDSARFGIAEFHALDADSSVCGDEESKPDNLGEGFTSADNSEGTTIINNVGSTGSCTKVNHINRLQDSSKFAPTTTSTVTTTSVTTTTTATTTTATTTTATATTKTSTTITTITTTTTLEPCDVDDGELKWTKPGTTTLVTATTFHADFGPQKMYPPASRGVKVAEPVDGCSALSTTFGNGEMALIKRGSCSFWIKALHAQLAGASGVIIDNDDREMLIMQCGDASPEKIKGTTYKCAESITIHAFFIPKAKGDLLRVDLASDSALELHQSCAGGARRERKSERPGDFPYLDGAPRTFIDNRDFFAKLNGYFPADKNGKASRLTEERCVCIGTELDGRIAVTTIAEWSGTLDTGTAREDTTDARIKGCAEHAVKETKKCRFEPSHVIGNGNQPLAIFDALNDVKKRHFDLDDNMFNGTNRAADSTRRKWLAERNLISSSIVVLISNTDIQELEGDAPPLPEGYSVDVAALPVYVSDGSVDKYVCPLPPGLTEGEIGALPRKFTRTKYKVDMRFISHDAFYKKKAELKQFTSSSDKSVPASEVPEGETVGTLNYPFWNADTCDYRVHGPEPATQDGDGEAAGGISSSGATCLIDAFVCSEENPPSWCDGWWITDKTDVGESKRKCEAFFVDDTVDVEKAINGLSTAQENICSCCVSMCGCKIETEAGASSTAWSACNDAMKTSSTEAGKGLTTCKNSYGALDIMCRTDKVCQRGEPCGVGENTNDKSDGPGPYPMCPSNEVMQKLMPKNVVPRTHFPDIDLFVFDFANAVKTVDLSTRRLSKCSCEAGHDCSFRKNGGKSLPFGAPQKNDEYWAILAREFRDNALCTARELETSTVTSTQTSSGTSTQTSSGTSTQTTSATSSVSSTATSSQTSTGSSTETSSVTSTATSTVTTTTTDTTTTTTTKTKTTTTGMFLL